LRAASEFVACAAQYKSDITIRGADDEDDDAVDAKSIVLLLTLGLGQGAEAVISAEGEDETEAVDAMIALIESKFGEE